MATKRNYRIVIACTNANGYSDLVPITVSATDGEYDDGIHYETAKAWAIDHGYGGPFVSFDENDGPSFLFEHFVWESGYYII